MRRIGRSLGVTMCTIALCVAATAAGGSTFYVSSSAGNDSWDGLSPVHRGMHGPWRSLIKASAAMYRPGDHLCLRCGDVWTGTLALHSDGSPAAPIALLSYGAGARPLIRANGAAGAPCVLLDRCAGWRISGIEMASGRNAVRIRVDSRVKTEYDTYHVEDCFFHDIANPAFPNAAKREGSQHNDLRNMGWALFVDGFDSPAPVRLQNVTVRHCVALHCQGFYIHVMGPVGADNVLFDGNTLSHISYNAIYQAGAKRFDIVNSVLVYGYPWAFHPNGATQVLAGGLEGDASARNVVRNNEFGWGGDYPGCPDGCAYDFEGATNGVEFSDNFIHDTSGEPVLFMGGFQHKDLLFDHNVLRDCVRFSKRWDSNVTVTASNTGTGTFTGNRFCVLPGKRAFAQKSPAYTFVDNDESAIGLFVAMPLVHRIASGPGFRKYALSCKTPGAVIRCTVDGSLPTESSRIYRGPVRVSRSCALNAKAFRPGWNPSYVNALVVDLRDAEGRPPAAHWPPARSADSAAPARRQAVLEGISDTFTLALWVRANGERAAVPEANTGVALESGQQWSLGPLEEDSQSGAGVALSVGTNGVGVYESASGYRPCMLSDDRPLAGWRHLTVVYRDKQPTLYVDGIFEKAGCKSERTVRPLFSLPAASAFEGDVRDVRVFDRPLTEAEIQALAAAPPPHP